MFIRRTKTRSAANSGKAYYSYRLVESRREGDRVRQITLLNLGRHFDVAQKDWPDLCSRLDQIVGNQAPLITVSLDQGVEAVAQQIAAQLVARQPADTARPEYAEVDVHSLEQVNPRSVGVEHVALDALRQLGLDALLEELGVPQITRKMITAQVVGRMAAPGSERATWKWLKDTSALEELIGLSFANLSVMRLYRAADVLLKHQDRIEDHLFRRVQDLLGFETTVTLYDLTNTYFEGQAKNIGKAKRGKSKEKRTDCPLLTLGLIVDGSGFVRRSRVFPGNAVEWRTLKEMLEGLSAPPGALVVMDRGLATKENLEWLREEGYRYLVVSREGLRLTPQGDQVVTTAQGDEVHVMKVTDEAAGEARLYCHSTLREAKERAILERSCKGLEGDLDKIRASLDKPRVDKRPEAIHQRVGKLRQRHSRVARHYSIQLVTDDKELCVTNLVWEQKPQPGSMLSDPGVYCLRTNETSWDESTLWHTYMTLTDLESVFRSMKSELGMRPIYHFKEQRCDAHLFISVLAYQCVQFIRRRLKARGISHSWSTLRATLDNQRRITARFKQRDGRTLHIRKATQPDAEQQVLYEALGLDPLPGGTTKHTTNDAYPDRNPQ